MDIFITGKQGIGKTKAAETFIKNFRAPFSKRYDTKDVLHIHDMFNDPLVICNMLREARVRAVVFDGCLNNLKDVQTAQAAVKMFRTQINAEVLAIYVTTDDVELTTEKKRNEFKVNPDKIVISKEVAEKIASVFDEFNGRLVSAFPGADIRNPDGTRYTKINEGRETFPENSTSSRSDNALFYLWDTVLDTSKDPGAIRNMRMKLLTFAPVGTLYIEIDRGFIPQLTPEAKAEMHEFLLKLLRDNE